MSELDSSTGSSATVTVVRRAIEALRESIDGALNSLTLVSPFISETAAMIVTDAAEKSGLEIRVITALREESVRGGSLSVDALRRLLGAGAEIRSIPNLHAKVILNDAGNCLVGSGNLTASGLGAIASGNVELGLRLSGRAVEEVRCEVERWWRHAAPVDEDVLDFCSDFAVPDRATAKRILWAHGVSLRDIDDETPPAVELDPFGPESGDTWLKPMHADGRAGEWWRSQAWMSTVHRRASDGRVLLQPSIDTGDRLLVYISGTSRCPAIYEVLSPPVFADAQPDDPDFEVLRRWGWRFDVRPIAACALDEAPTLEELTIRADSVRQKSYIRIPESTFERAYEAITNSATATGDDQLPVAAGSEFSYATAAALRDRSNPKLSREEVEQGLRSAYPSDVARRLLRIYAALLQAGARESLGEQSATLWLGERTGQAINPYVWVQGSQLGISFRDLRRRRTRDEIHDLLARLDAIPGMTSLTPTVRESETDSWLSCAPAVATDRAAIPGNRDRIGLVTR